LTTHISSVKNLQLSVGKLQLSEPTTECRVLLPRHAWSCVLGCFCTLAAGCWSQSHQLSSSPTLTTPTHTHVRAPLSIHCCCCVSPAPLLCTSIWQC